jgi:SAM-dependent methyltransferase
MTDSPPDPTATHELFEHERVAAGYVSARPFLHPEVFARVADLIPIRRRVPRGLDVGCGTGMSSVALLELAREVTGVDVSVPMLQHARPTDGVHYLASTAEELPFRAGSFDLVTACGAIDWVDRGRFLPRAAELLTRGGWLVPLDFGDARRSPAMPALEAWHQQVLEKRWPTPFSPDPMVTGLEASRCGLGEPRDHRFETEWSFTASEYADFLMTESNVIAAVEYGESSAPEIRRWLEEELSGLFGERSRPVTFAGYIQVIPRP